MKTEGLKIEKQFSEKEIPMSLKDEKKDADNLEYKRTASESSGVFLLIRLLNIKEFDTTL